MQKPIKLENDEKKWKSPFETAIKYFKYWALDLMYDKN
jgi:hypothetical protein